MPDLHSEIGLAKKELAALLPSPIRDPPIVLAKQVSAIEFATSPEYLGLALYPLQGTLVKVIAAQPETFTSYDAEVLDELTSGFAIVDDRGRDRYAGSRGLSPDLAKRLEWLRESGAPGFREVVMVAGRRFGKSYLAAICSLYRLWQTLQLGDPHQESGIDPDKRLFIPIISGSLERARRDQFGDLISIIARSPCFAPFVVGDTTSRVFMTTSAGLMRSRPGAAPVLIEIAAVETTTLSTRGPAIPISIFDEVAHLIGAGSTADFADLYATTLPATAQFRQYALVWMGSSPSTQEGQFFESYCRGLSVGPDGAPTEPDVLVVQLESWSAYRDWDRAHTIRMWPDGPCFPTFTCPILEYNDQLRAIERDNPSTFSVEFRAQWATVLDAYLPPSLIDGLFAPWGDRVLQNGAPAAGHHCVAHADPSVSQAGFGFALGHRDAEHNVMDLLHAWNPRDFPNGRIDYDVIEDEIFQIGMLYKVAELTFDQFESAGMSQRLQRRFKEAGLTTYVHVARETGRANWTNAEGFKTALGQNLVHAPRHALAEAELRALQLVGPMKVGPSRKGTTTTCDIADCMIAVVAMLTSAKNMADICEQFSNAHPTPPRGYRGPAERFSGPRLPYHPGRRSPW